MHIVSKVKLGVKITHFVHNRAEAASNNAFSDKWIIGHESHRRDVPRTIGRAVRGTPWNGTKIIYMFAHAVSEEVFPEQSAARR